MHAVEVWLPRYGHDCACAGLAWQLPCHRTYQQAALQELEVWQHVWNPDVTIACAMAIQLVA